MGLQGGSLNENGLHRHTRLNIWFLVGGTVWEGEGSMALLEGSYCGKI